MYRSAIPALLSAAFFVTPAHAVSFQMIYSDQTTDQIIHAFDLNGDGDANDAGETSVFFDGTNVSGLAQPTGSVFTMTQGTGGEVYVGDGGSDTVYRLQDRNGNNNAQDAGEAQVWFSADNAEGLALITPNGVAQGGDGAIYVVEADTVGTPNGDFVYRTRDLNGDGDANDAGESSVWLDLTALSPTSSPFEIRFDGDVAYIIDSNGGGTNVVYRAEDTNADGQVTGSEVSVYIDENDAPVDFALSVFGGDVFTMELLDFSGSQSLFRIDDVNADGVIDGFDDIIEVWNGDGTDLFAAFSLDVRDNMALVTSNGGAATQDLIMSLIDRNLDGDFFDDNEAVPFLSRDQNGVLPVRPRSVIFYDPTIAVSAVPVPAALPLLASGLIVLGVLGRRKRTARPA